jgi:hypothetical protein
VKCSLGPFCGAREPLRVILIVCESWTGVVRSVCAYAEATRKTDKTSVAISFIVCPFIAASS